MMSQHDAEARAETAEAGLERVVVVLEEIASHPGPNADDCAHWRADLARDFLTTYPAPTQEPKE